MFTNCYLKYVNNSFCSFCRYLHNAERQLLSNCSELQTPNTDPRSRMLEASLRHLKLLLSYLCAKMDY